MAKKSKSTTTSNSTVTSTPTNPQWVTDSVSGLQTRINGLLDTDAASLVPGASSLQTKAYDQAGNLGGWQTGNADAVATTKAALGADPTAQQATSRSLLDVDIDGYMNPFQEQVIDSSLASYDEQRGMEEAEMRAAQARGQKFSGSGDAIRRAMFDRGTLQDRTGIESNLRSQGYDRATGLATGDLDREAATSQFNAGQANQMATANRDAQLRGAGLLGDLSNASASNERADLGLLSELGGEQREIEREKLGADTQLLQLISQLNGQQPYGLFRGETQTGDSTSTTKSKQYGLGNTIGTIGSAMSGIGSMMSGAGAMGFAFSDKRLKEDIQTEGKDGAGRRVVSYRYKGEPKDVRRIGHIAQEVAKTDPHAVRKVGKYLGIDYGLLEDAA